MRVPTVLVDARNIDQLLPRIKSEVAAAPLLGFDIESHDANAHEGIVEYRKKDGAKCFDYRRTTVTGFSTYCPEAAQSYYVNLGHADVENRVPWPVARQILDARSPNCPLVIHNDPYERTVMKNSLDFDVGETICTLQLAVSAFGPDEYDKEEFGKIMTWPFIHLLPKVIHEFQDFDKSKYEITTQQAKLLGQVVGKESTAEHSYNGFNRSIAYGYGLKQLVRNLLHEEIGGFKELLEKFGAAHMGELTGEQVADYGGDDSYFAIILLNKLLTMIRPEALAAFERQEMPMTKVYSDILIGGAHINHDEVKSQFLIEEQNHKDSMVAMRKAVEAALPFDPNPCAELAKREDWYAKNYKTYRDMITDWKRKDKKPLNLTHYMPVRTLLYDLMKLPILLEKGKVQSDGEARGQLMEKATGPALDLLRAMNGIAGIDQRIKLYLKPYKLLIDPETDKIYSNISSMLATRRMAASNTNVMQLSKDKDAAYIRGFYLPDTEDDI